LSDPAARKVCEKFHVYPETVEMEAGAAVNSDRPAAGNGLFTAPVSRASAKVANFHA
jgi:hypothetical protein